MKKLIVFFLLLFATFAIAKKDISVYTYHNHAPFIVNDSGLTYDLIDYLNKGQDKYKFILKVIPRKRLNYILKPWINKECQNGKKCDKNWLLLWVNHKWGFGKDSLENFLWTPLFKDSNAIISSKEKNFEYTGPKSLINKTLAGVGGHKYIGIDDLVKKGLITRIDGKNEVKNLEVVYNNRADVTLLAKSAFDYYKKNNSRFETLYNSKTPHQEYQRNIMTNSYNKDLIDTLKSLKLEELYK